MNEYSYTSVVVSLRLNGGSLLLLMYVGIPTVILGSAVAAAAAAGTPLRVPRTQRWGVLICADDHGNCLGKKEIGKPTVSISMGTFTASDGINSWPPNARACGGESSPITRWDCGT